MNPVTVDKLGKDLLEALTKIKGARDLLEGSYRHAESSGGENTGLAKQGEALVGQLDRLYKRVTKYKSEIVQTTQEAITVYSFSQRPMSKGGNIAKGTKGSFLIEPTETGKYKPGQQLEIQDRHGMYGPYPVRITRVDPKSFVVEFVITRSVKESNMSVSPEFREAVKKELKRQRRARVTESNDVGAAALALDKQIKDLVGGYNALSNKVMIHPDKERMKSDFDSVGYLIAQSIKARKHLRKIIEVARGL